MENGISRIIIMESSFRVEVRILETHNSSRHNSKWWSGLGKECEDEQGNNWFDTSIGWQVGKGCGKTLGLNFQ